MTRVIGSAVFFVCLVMVSALYAGSGYDAIPETDYLKRKIGEDAYIEGGKTSLDRFYLWKQKSLEEEQADVPEETARGGDAGIETTQVREAGAGKARGETTTGNVFRGTEVVSPDVSQFQAEFSVADLNASPGIEMAPVNQIAPDYILGSGDVLEISIWKDEALSRVVPILPDGTIHFPLIGQLHAAGKTAYQLQQEVDEKISRYVPNPFVDVSVQQVNSMLIYIIGKVRSPGRFVINTNVSVIQALAMAGGLNTFAKEEKIKIIREKGGQQKILNFNYEDVATGKDLSQNFRMERGDIIVVH